MVLAHSRASAVSEKHPWSSGEAKVRLDRAQFRIQKHPGLLRRSAQVSPWGTAAQPAPRGSDAGCCVHTAASAPNPSVGTGTEGQKTKSRQFREKASGLPAVQGQLLELIAAGCQQDKI